MLQSCTLPLCIIENISDLGSLVTEPAIIKLPFCMIMVPCVISEYFIEMNVGEEN